MSQVDSISPNSLPAGTSAWWPAALLGLFGFLFAVVALSGPGRIDVVDGQTRYEVGRSLVEHGDLLIRDPNVEFSVFPGRDGQRYTTYRFPQSLLAAGAIVVADATGSVAEGRRHFFFVLTSALAAALLGVAYAVWFRRLGLSPGKALGWALAGIFCTPSWFYGTSTFDEILGSATVVLAVVTAFGARRHRPLFGAALAGLLLGLAFNCKQPLGIFLLPVLAGCYDPKRSFRSQMARGAVVVAGLALGVAAYKGYDWYKYPPGTTEGHAELMKNYGPLWAASPLPGLCAFALSPAAGVLWYCPPLLLCGFGLAVWWRSERSFCQALLVAAGVFVVFIAWLSFYKGDPAWGPRYWTPIFALAWLFAPAGAQRLSPRLVVSVLTLGLVVQLLGLSVDQHRMFLQRRLPPSYPMEYPWLSFHPLTSNLFNRPGEIVAILRSDHQREEAYSPSPTPTFSFPVIVKVDDEEHAWIHRYHLLNSLRPWWISQKYLAPEDRPVDLGATAALLVLLAAAGAGTMAAAVYFPRSRSMS